MTQPLETAPRSEPATPTRRTLTEAELAGVVGGDGSNRAGDEGPGSPGDKTS